MSNTGRITLCPFYKNHKKRTISCEDTLRFYPKAETLSKHMDRFCDANWKECKFAKAYMDHLNDDKYVGDMAAKELRKTIAHIGKLDKKINKLERENEAYSKVLVRRTVDVKKQEQAIDELLALLKLQESRLCYMAEKNDIKELDLKGFDEWIESDHVKQTAILNGTKLEGIKFIAEGEKKF